MCTETDEGYGTTVHGTRDIQRPELHCGILDFPPSKDDLPTWLPSR